MTHFVGCRASRRGEARRGVARRGVARRGVEWRGVEWRGVEWRGVEWRGVKGTAIIGVPFSRGWRLRTARERRTEPRTPTYTHSPVETTAQRGATTGTGSRILEEEGRGLSAAGRRMAHLASLLLRAGDVETNPGPRFSCGCTARESATPLCSAARAGSDTTPDVSASRQPTSAASPGGGEPGPAASVRRRLPRRPPPAPPTPQPQPPTATARRDATPTAAAGPRERRPAPSQAEATGRLQREALNSRSRYCRSCNGLAARLTELPKRLADTKPQVVLLQETKLAAQDADPPLPGV